MAATVSQELVTATGEDAGNRLDRVLAMRVPALSRSRLKTLILAGEVAIGGRTIRDPGHRVNSGDAIAVTLPEPVAPEPQAENIPLNIVYEDDDLIVIDKPKGLVVHPAAGHWSGTLVNALIAHCGASLSGIGGVRRPGIVHRLDKDTTGLMVVAKNDRAHKSLAAQFADHGRAGSARFEAEQTPLSRPDAKPLPSIAGHGFRRGYLAFVWGAPDRPRGTIDAPLDRHPHAREKRAVRAGGRQAITHWQLLETFPGDSARGKAGPPLASLLACQLETGRTHQIRVHLAHIGHPILGDTAYGTGFRTKSSRLPLPAQHALEDLGRQALHAYLLAIEHPATGKILEFRSELPGDMRRLRNSLAGATRLVETNNVTKSNI